MHKRSSWHAVSTKTLEFSTQTGTQTSSNLNQNSVCARNEDESILFLARGKQKDPGVNEDGPEKSKLKLKRESNCVSL